MPENSKKFLWLAAAVSLFTLIVVGAAFLIFAPAKTSGQVPFDLSGKAEPRQDSPQDYLANPPADMSTTQTTSNGDIIIVYGNDPNAPANGTQAQPKPATTTIVVSPSTPVTTVAPATKIEAPKPAASQPAPKTAASQPESKQTVVTTPAQKTPAAKPATPSAQVGSQSGGDYWIQAGVFSVKENADSLKGSLAGKSLPAIITVKDTDGKSRYIVKVGPYPTRAEAGKWLSAAKSVKGAEQAWITQ